MECHHISTKCGWRWIGGGDREGEKPVNCVVELLVQYCFLSFSFHLVEFDSYKLCDIMFIFLSCVVCVHHDCKIVDTLF
jgi:hypothetical protein